MAKAQTIIVRNDHLLARVIDFISKLNTSKAWEITIKPYRKKRTLSQNALMWKWINVVTGYVSEDTGMTNDEVHEFFKQKFLQPKIFEVNGEIFQRWTTTDLTTAEMAEYMDHIYRWGTGEQGYFLPTPEMEHAR